MEKLAIRLIALLIFGLMLAATLSIFVYIPPKPSDNGSGLDPGAMSVLLADREVGFQLSNVRYVIKDIHSLGPEDRLGYVNASGDYVLLSIDTQTKYLLTAIVDLNDGVVFTDYKYHVPPPPGFMSVSIPRGAYWYHTSDIPGLMASGDRDIYPMLMNEESLRALKAGEPYSAYYYKANESRWIYGVPDFTSDPWGVILPDSWFFSQRPAETYIVLKNLNETDDASITFAR